MTANSMRPYLTCQGWGLVGIASLAFGCSDPVAVHIGQVRDSVIYGEDTRRDVYAVDNAQLAQLAIQSTVAFLSAEHLVNTPDGRLEIVSDTLGESNNLCPGQAFETQPAAATCSGVLIDDQLALTAGHCVPEDAACSDQLLVFGYAIVDPDGVLAVDAAAIYRCKSILVRGHGVDGDGRRLDYAVIELDRPVDAARRPVEIASEVSPVGSNVTVIGYPSGLPAKVDSGAQVLYARPCLDYFTISSDTFQASSGSGVFDDRGRLVGSFVRGGADYEFVPDRGCAVARRIVDVADPMEAEQASYVAPAIAALCASGWASTKLCPVDADRGDSGAGQDAGACEPEPAGDGGLTGGCTASGRHDRGCSAGALVATIALVLGRRRSRPASRSRTAGD